MASLINRLWSGADFWQKEENRKQREQFAKEARQKQPVRDNTPGFQITNNSLTRGVSRAIDQVNPADGGRTWKQRTPINPLSSLQQINQNKVVQGVIESPRAIGEGLAAKYSPDVRAANDALRKSQEMHAKMIADAGKRIRDPKTPQDVRNRYTKSYPNLVKNANSIGAQASQRADEQIKATNPKRMAAATADAAFTALTAGVGTTGAKGVYTAAKGGVKQGAEVLAKQSAKTASLSAPSGAMGTVVVNPNASAKDIAKGATIAGTVGAALPVASVAARPVVQAGGKAIAKGVRTATPEVKPVYADFLPDVPKRKPQTPAEQTSKQTSLEPSASAQTPATQRPSVSGLGSSRTASRELLGPENLILKMQEASPSVKGSTNSVVKQSNIKQSRTAEKTAPNSLYVSDELAESVKKNAPTYTAETQEGRLGSTGARLSKNEDEFTKQLEKKLDTEPGKISSQDVTDTQGLAAVLDARGDELSLQKATDLYTKLSEHLTAAGQTVQAAALIAQRTPQGLRFYAQKQLEKAGIKLTPENTVELKKLIDEVKKAKPGSDAELIARDNVQYWIAKNIPSTKSDQIVNFWRSGLLTAPTTTGGALAGNTFATLQRKLWINPIATMTDMVLALGTGKRGRALAVPGAFGQGFKRGGNNVRTGQYWKTGYDPMNPNATAESMGSQSRRVNYGNGRMGKAMGTYVNGVYKLMGAADQPFRYAAYDETMSSLARTEAINRGIRGADRAQFIEEFTENPPAWAKQRATDEAMDATFQNRTVLADAITSIKQGLKQKGHHKAAALVDFFIPFSGVPSSVASRVIRHTPIGTANTLVKQLFAVSRGEAFDQRLMSQAIAEGSAGVPIVAAGFALANAGQITGGYPSDPKERQRWTDEGKQENSIKIGNRWYSMNYIQPFGTLLSVGAGIAQAEGEDGENPALSDYLTQATQSGVKSFAGQSYLEGVTAPLEAINNPEQEAGRYIAGAASGIVPNFIRSAARASDTVQRDASGVVDGIKGAIPGLRQTLPAKVGSDGNPLPNKDNFLNMYANPLKPSKAREENPVVRETSRLLELGLGVSAAPVKSVDFGDKTVKLDKRQREEYNSALGQLRTEQWNKAMNSLDYMYMTDEERQGYLQKVSKDVNAVVKFAFATQYGIANPPELTEAQTRLLENPDEYVAKGKGFPKDDKESVVKTAKSRRKSAKTSSKKGGRKTAKKKGGSRKGGGRKQIPSELLAKSQNIPKIGRAKQAKIVAKSPSAAKLKKARKAIPKIAKSAPSTPKVTRLRA